MSVCSCVRVTDEYLNEYVYRHFSDKFTLTKASTGALIIQQGLALFQFFMEIIEAL